MSPYQTVEYKTRYAYENIIFHQQQYQYF